MLLPTSSLFCLYGFYLYPSFMPDDLCRVLERLCCRMFTGCGHCTSFNTDWIFPILNFKANIPDHTRENVWDVLQVFSSTMIHFCPVYLCFVHASGNECFRYSYQAFNMSELGTANQLFLGSSFSTGFGIIPASCLWGGKESCILGALLRLSALSTEIPSR